MNDKEPLREAALWIIGAIFLLLLIGFLGWAMRALFAPAHEEIDRKVYDQSRAYQQGMAVDLDDLCRQRKLSNDDGVRAVLADTIRLRSARFNGELPSHIQECLNEVR